jgi:hypothetical protein
VPAADRLASPAPEGINALSDTNDDHHNQIDEETLTTDISDEALEAAAGMGREFEPGQTKTTHCFSC